MSACGLAACLLMAGCQQMPAEWMNGARREVTLMGEPEAYVASATRSVIGGTTEAGTLVMRWSAGDRVGVFGTSSSNVPFTSTNAEPADRASFQGTMLGTESPLYAYYPYVEGASDLSAIPVTIPAEQAYADVTSVAQYDVKASSQITQQPDGTYRCQMRQMACLLRFEINLSDVASVIASLDDEAADASAETLLSATISSESALTGTYTYDLSRLADGLTPVECGTELTLTLAAQPTLTGVAEAYAVVAPGAQNGREWVIDLLTDKHQVQLTTHALCDFQAGAFYHLPLNASVFNNASNQVAVSQVSDPDTPDPPEVTEETANCYMVTQPGEHSFVATQIGNGDKGIIAGAGFHVTSTRIAPRSARLLWQDTQDFVSDVRLAEGRVWYQAGGNVGNAVIAVYSGEDGTGDILWSWHIWGVGDEVPADVEITNQAGAKFTMMNRTLGALSPTSCQATLYQWGRKDPFPNAPVYYVDGQAVDISTSFPVYKPATTDEAVIATSVQHCDRLITVAHLNQWDWLYTDNPYLWGDTDTRDRFTWYSNGQLSNAEAGAGWTDQKTIYDPSPVGYRVANQFTFTGFAGETDGDVELKGDMNEGDVEQKFCCIVESFSDGSVTCWKPKFEQGYFFKANADDATGCYFPMTGTRHASDGSYPEAYGTSVFYWTSAPQQNAHQAQALYIGPYRYLKQEAEKGTAAGNNAKMDVGYYRYKWYAQPVRCVREN